MAEQPPPPSAAASAPCWSNIVKSEPPQSKNSQCAAILNRVFAESCNSTKGIAVAVVDASAVIHGGERLSTISDKFVSVTEVINEIRDPVSRHRLDFVPFTIDTVEPSPEALRKVINFARATGDLHTLSAVDLKLIALTYTLEAQVHGTEHLRDCPPPVHVVNVKRLPEKDMPGWGTNVPNLDEWEALEHESGLGSKSNSRILPLKDLNLNIIRADDPSTSEDVVGGTGGEVESNNQEGMHHGGRSYRRYPPKKKEVNIEGKKMVTEGIDASQGQHSDDDTNNWLPAVSRSTHRKYLRRKARRESYEASFEKDAQDDVAGCKGSNKILDDHLSGQGCEEIQVEDGPLKETKSKGETTKEKNNNELLSSIMGQLRLEKASSEAFEVEKDPVIFYEILEADSHASEETALDSNNINVATNEDETGLVDESLHDADVSSQTCESINESNVDDNSSEQSGMLRSLSESSVACVTSDFAMQNVLLQMGLRLLAPGGMQIRELHRWILKCHACYTVTAEVGRIFCPKCGNGGTLRKVAVTVGENGVVLADRRPRITLRGTRFSLPLPRSGRNAVTENPILREDQLPPKLLHAKSMRKKQQGDDVLVPEDIFCQHPRRKAPLRPPVRKALAIFSGKRNPNDNHYYRSKNH